MYRNGKSAAALGLAVLLGCMMPVSTMLAAGENAGTGAGSVSENDMFREDENVSDRENAGGMQSSGIMAVSDAGLNGASDDDDDNDNTSEDAPEILIKRGGENRACGLGGEITFEYIGYTDTLFEVSVAGSDKDISLYCALDSVADTETGAKEKEQMSSLPWGKITSPYRGIMPLNDGNYVVYVKVEKKAEDDKTETYYARSSGVVLDTKQPVIKGVEEGKVYPEGTLFQVEDANLDKVLVNEQEASPENGSYKVVANGTSCVIRAIDKAGHQLSCSITVSGTVKPEEPKPEEPKPEEPKPEEPKPEEPKPEEPKPEEPGTGTEEPKPEEPGAGTETPDEGVVISKNGEYTLRAGVKHRLAEGKWKVNGDKSVYQGGRAFYVIADGSYKFSK